jgi:hypothetical protein
MNCKHVGLMQTLSFEGTEEGTNEITNLDCATWLALGFIQTRVVTAGQALLGNVTPHSLTRGC